VNGRQESALLVVGHGSTVNPDSSAPTLAHAAEIRRRNIFGDVACAFWKEEPSLRDAIFLFDPDAFKNVYVVPNFISEGYFTQTVIPRELELNGRVTKRASGQTWNYGEPVGNHPLMTELLVGRARDIAPGISENETSLLIVAHGTDLNENSAVAAKREAGKIRALGRYANVLNVYMEEFPLVSDWKVLTSTPNVVVLFYFRRPPQLRRHTGVARNRRRKIDIWSATNRRRSLPSRPVQDRQSFALLCQLDRDRFASGRYYRRAGDRSGSGNRFSELTQEKLRVRPASQSFLTAT
jgi:sirohydrochlorin cobaltochelatase